MSQNVKWAFGFLNIQSVAKYQKNRRGPFEDNIKFSKKNSESRKKSKGLYWSSSVLSSFAKAGKRWWLQHELEHATYGFNP